MATKTKNLGLTKPDPGEFYDVIDSNGNMDIIDENITAHLADKSNPHSVTKSDVGLGNVSNTSDSNKPVSTAQQTAIDAAYQQSTGYTDTKIANLINGAPQTLDTLKEVADAIQQNESVVTALDSAVGKKANQAELDTHTNNSTIHITSTERTKWNAKQDAMTVDSALSSTSTNPVQNKAVNAALTSLNTDLAGLVKYKVITVTTSTNGFINIANYISGCYLYATVTTAGYLCLPCQADTGSTASFSKYVRCFDSNMALLSSKSVTLQVYYI